MTGEVAGKPKVPGKFPQEIATHDTSADSSGKNLGPGRARPVMIHRAIIGSFERFLGILIEHFAGKWPFWISPPRTLIVPVMPSVNDYVEELQRILQHDKLNVDIDVSGNTMHKKIGVGSWLNTILFLVSILLITPSLSCFASWFPRLTC